MNKSHSGSCPSVVITKVASQVRPGNEEDIIELVIIRSPTESGGNVFDSRTVGGGMLPNGRNITFVAQDLTFSEAISPQ